MSTSPSNSSPRPAASNADTQLSIADLLASGVVLQWFEAVAIMQGLCLTINESSQPTTEKKLALDQIIVDPAGTISISSRPDPESALPQLKKLLLEMIPSSEAAQAKALPDSSLEDFARALEYHERPNRAEVIQEVRSRWRPLPVAKFDKVEKTVESSAILDAESETTDKTKRPPVPRLIIAMAAAVVILAVAVWELSPSNVEAKATKTADVAPTAAVPPSAEVTSSKDPVSAVPSSATTSGSQPTSTAREHAATAPMGVPKADAAGPPRPAVRPATPGSATSGPASAPAASKGPAAARPASSATPSAAASSASAPLAPVTDRVGLPVAPVVAAATRLPPAVANPPAAMAAAVPPTAAESADEGNEEVFDASESDVVPPTFLTADLRPAPPEAGQTDSLAIEVMVNERGTIEGAKACRAPRTLAESMQIMNELSVAKNWRFRPATRDGHPVKYRLVVLTARVR